MIMNINTQTKIKQVETLQTPNPSRSQNFTGDWKGFSTQSNKQPCQRSKRQPNAHWTSFSLQMPSDTTQTSWKISVLAQKNQHKNNPGSAIGHGSELRPAKVTRDHAMLRFHYVMYHTHWNHPNDGVPRNKIDAEKTHRRLHKRTSTAIKCIAM